MSSKLQLRNGSPAPTAPSIPAWGNAGNAEPRLTQTSALKAQLITRADIVFPLKPRLRNLCVLAPPRLCVYPSAPVKERRPRRQAIRRACFILKTSPLLPIEPPLPQKNLQKTTNFILRKVFERDWKSVRAVIAFLAWKTHLLHALAGSFFFLTASKAPLPLPPGPAPSAAS